MLVFLFVIIDLYYWLVCSLQSLARKMAKHSKLVWILNFFLIWSKFDSKLTPCTIFFITLIRSSLRVFLCLSSFSYSLVELERGQVINVISVLLSFLCAWSICWDVPCCRRAISDKGKTVYLGQNTCGMSPSLSSPSYAFCSIYLRKTLSFLMHLPNLQSLSQNGCFNTNIKSKSSSLISV